ncbi:Extracellular solute-binding protein family 5 [Desulfamplus magnetovallimortis]|uniref:Extracellular solute-binding protein family 5 n=1 Tax=Desulfamplus magnetovallimortis TaxID=1246637 RepID=A0A1W1HID8_9BACT|nr:ABC transporter substrate-binding protein [Desulfamplus magnetovallimortis]SLM32216.1 Extracellular solute-binding protein family 5 [Desulfamplus magnetovallimortis]
MKNVFIVAGLAIFLSMGIIHHIPCAEAKEKVLRIGMAKEPAKLNPVFIPGIYGEAVAGNIFDTLVSYKENASMPTPLLASKWEISEDGKEYTFHLREDVKFHNNEKLTAKDVKFTLEAIMDTANASPSKEFFEPVERIETDGDFIIKLHLKNPYAPLMLALGSHTAGIMPADHVKQVGMDAFDSHPVGTGPFIFVEWLPDERIVLKKNPGYFLAEPAIDKVIFRPIPKPEVMAAEIESGGIDIAQNLLPQDISRLEKEGNLNVMTIAGLGNSYLGFSYKKAPFSDPRFRKAVYHAVPFDAAIKGIWKGVGERSYSWIPDGVFPFDTEYMKSRALPHDKEKAEEYFNELKKEGILQDGFEFSIYTSQNPHRVKIATVVATELRKYGLKAKVESLEWGTLFPILKNDSGCYIMGWGSVPDPDRWTYKIFHSGSTMNFSKYELPEIDEALDLGRSLVSSKQRGEQYIKVMRKALGEDYIHIPLVFKSVTVVTGKNIEGFTPSPQDYFHLVTEKRNVTVN